MLDHLTFFESSCVSARQQAAAYYNTITKWTKGKSIYFDPNMNEWVVTVDNNPIAFSCAFIKDMPVEK